MLFEWSTNTDLGFTELLSCNNYPCHQGPLVCLPPCNNPSTIEVWPFSLHIVRNYVITWNWTAVKVFIPVGPEVLYLCSIVLPSMKGKGHISSKNKPSLCTISHFLNYRSHSIQKYLESGVIITWNHFFQRYAEDCSHNSILTVQALSQNYKRVVSSEHGCPVSHWQLEIDTQSTSVIYKNVQHWSASLAFCLTEFIFEMTRYFCMYICFWFIFVFWGACCFYQLSIHLKWKLN